MTSAPPAPHLVIVVANVPLRRDRRVSREAATLAAAGYRVTVICPRDGEAAALPGSPEVGVVQFGKPVEGSGPVGFLVEFVICFLQVSRLVFAVHRRQRVSGVQFCNPPDIFFPLAALLRRRDISVVFDHHDVSPEIYLARGGQAGSVLHRLLLRLERASVRNADMVVSTNESLRLVAVGRGGVAADRAVVVRNGPLVAEIDAVGDGGAGRGAGPVCVVYLGVLGRQDGVDAFVRMARLVVDQRPGTEHVIIGDGEMLPALRQLASSLGLDGQLSFTGWLDPADVSRRLAAADIAVQPDPRNQMNEMSTMAKTVEYLAHGLATVAVDLIETRRTAGSAAVYVPDNDPRLLADAVVALVDSPARRARLGRQGALRVERELSWDHQATRYLAAWERSLSASAFQDIGAGRRA